MSTMRWAVTLAWVAMQWAATAALAQDAAPADRRVEAHLDTNAQAAVAGVNLFSLDLYRRSISPARNLFLSPASVSTAVGLAYRGARGATAQELRAVMRFTAPPQAYLSADAAILRATNFAGEGRELRVANAIWVQQGLPLLPDFGSDMTGQAKAGLEQADFRRDSVAARLTINRWVAEATHDRIKDLLHEGDVTKETRAVLVNSIYWKGRWATPFEAESTRTEPFTGLDGARTATPLMHRRDQFQVIERGGVRAIELPYALGEVSMVVLLPGSPSALPRFEAKLTDRELQRWLSDLDAARPRDTALTLPKMHLEWRDDLVPSLAALGATTAFTDGADFTGMAAPPFPDDPTGAQGLKIGKVIHQTYLDVDEAGSEAAAATAVGEIVISALRMPPPPPPFIFRADKPFMFLLRDRRTGLILFMGRYVTPAR